MARLAATVVAVPWLSTIQGKGPAPRGRKLVTTIFAPADGTGTLWIVSRSRASSGWLVGGGASAQPARMTASISAGQWWKGCARDTERDSTASAFQDID